jgi:hypothetical protein
MTWIFRGRRPQPIHGQSDVVLSGASSQKLVFFASFYRILVKGGIHGIQTRCTSW